MTPRVPIGDCVEQCRAWNPAVEDALGTFTYIDLSSVDKDSKRIVSPTTVACVNAPSRARQLVAVGDILVSTVRPNLNGVAIVPPELDGATASTGYTVLRPRLDLLHGPYLFQWVKSPTFVSEMVRLATGASYPAVSDKIVRESLIPLPPLPEQRRIAALLGKADTVRTKRGEALAKINQFLQAVFLDMFGDPCDPSDKHGWKRIPFPTVCAVTFGFPFDAKHFGPTGAHKLVRIRDVVPGDSQTFYTGNEVFDPQHEVNNGDILVGMDGNFNAARWKGGHALLNQRVCKVIPKVDYVDEHFLFSCLPHFLKRIESETPAVTVKHLSAKRIRDILVPVPPRNLQARFATISRTCEGLRLSCEAFVPSLDALFASQQARAFGGK